MPARRSRSLLALLVAGVLASTVVAGPAASASSAASHPSYASKNSQRFVDHLINKMTLEEKVGQLFVTYAYGATADTTDPADVAANEAELGVANGTELVEKYHLGGVIYFAWSRNVANPAQIAGLSNGLQRVATAQRVHIPLLISTDQEHGVVTRVGPPATQLPGNMALGAGGSTGDTYDAGQISGKELRAIGINRDFAPDADVNVNAQNPVIGVRSFGSDPSLVSSLVSANIAGYQDANVSTTAKHFPGHGDTATDSHFGVPIINHTARPVGSHRRTAVPRRHQARCRLDHDGAHRRPRARPDRHTRRPCPSRSSPTPCAASWATRASSSPMRSPCRAYATGSATTASRCWPCRPASTSC